MNISTRADISDLGQSGHAAKPETAVPAVKRGSIDSGRPRLITFVVFLVGAELLPVALLQESQLLILGLACIYAIAAIGLNVVFGTGGLLSVAQAALMAVGGYAFILLYGDPLSLPLAGLVGCVLAAAVSALTGIVAGRVKTHYFILVSFAVAEIILLGITHLRDLTGGSTGVPIKQIPTLAGFDLSLPLGFYQVAVVVVAIVWYLGDTFRAARPGLALRAMTADEYLATAAGVSLFRHRVVATVVGGAFAGLAGAMLAMHDGYLGPQNFELNTAIMLLLIVVVAGRARNGAVVLAAVVLTFLSQGLLELRTVGQLVYGVALVLLLILAPNGLSGAATAVRSALTRRRRRLLASREGVDTHGG